MGTRGGRDFHGQAAAGFERTLRNTKGQKEVKVLTLVEQIKQAESEEEAKREALITKRKEERKAKEEEVRFTNYREPNVIVPRSQREPKEKKPREPRVVTPEFVEVTKDVQLTQVLYGIKGTTIDITDKVKPGQKVNNKVAGQDPASGKRKSVYVKAIVDGVEVEKIFAEGKYLEF